MTAEQIANAIAALDRIQHIQVNNNDAVSLGRLRAEAMLAALDLRAGLRHISVPVKEAA